MSATLETVIEVLLLASGRALKVDEIVELAQGSVIDADRKRVREALANLGERWQERGLELREVASGFRLQVRSDYASWLSRLWAERPARYSRALLETLALIAYRQPITRGEIEDVRGVSVSASIVKTLLEREWVRVLGHREVPGRPAIYGTTRTFLDDFNLTGLEDLPPLAEVRDIDRFHDDLFNDNAAQSAGDVKTGDAAESGDVAGPDSEGSPGLAVGVLDDAGAGADTDPTRAGDDASESLQVQPGPADGDAKQDAFVQQEARRKQP